MNIAIVGYGQMGKMIMAKAKKKGINVISIIDPKNPEAMYKEINDKSLKDADVCIDFTTPSVVLENVKKYCKFKKNFVMGTTGWYDQIDEVKSMVENAEVGAIWSGNFSIGVNVFFEIINQASKIINRIDNYDIMGVEYHHNKKADSPSGTMKMIGDILINNINNKNKAVYEMLDRKINNDEIHLASVRGGSIPGIHKITLDSPADTITLEHCARTREGFASGAVMAAEFIKGRKGFFEIKDLMEDVIRGN